MKRRNYDIDAPLDYYFWVGGLTLLILALVIVPEQITGVVASIANRVPGVKLEAKNELKSTAIANKPETNPDDITALRRAIIGQESGGKFNAVNPHSNALGYGQLMPYNVAPWTKEALGKPLTPRQYLNNPEAQIKTIDHKLSQYFREGLKATGNSLEAVRFTASKWYSGRGSLKDNAKPQHYNGAKYPSIKNYADSVKEKFEREKNR
jgi:hypothetical protein